MLGELSGLSGCLDFLFCPVLLVLPVEEVGDDGGCGGEAGGVVDGVVVVVDGECDIVVGSSCMVIWGIPVLGQGSACRYVSMNCIHCIHLLQGKNIKIYLQLPDRVFGKLNRCCL